MFLWKSVTKKTFILSSPTFVEFFVCGIMGRFGDNWIYNMKKIISNSYQFVIIVLISITTLLFVDCSGSDLASVHKGTPKVTKAQFDQLKVGMSLSEIKRVIGGDCVVQSESGEVGSQFHTVMYGCDGKGQLGANMNFMMQGGKLINKAQYGLQ